MTIQYKCPDCGSDLVFDAVSGKLKCQNCGHEEVVTQGGEMQISEDHPHQAVGDESGEIFEYTCQSCGAKIMVNKNTAATQCAYCGAPVVINDRVSGVVRPDCVIPFKYEKRDADMEFQQWTKKLFFAPSDFKNMVKVKSVEGLYAPFWIYDVKGQGSALAECTKSRSYREGDYQVTETRHYDAYRQIDTNFEKVPADASKRLDDHMMDVMEPFHFEELQNFAPAFLSGYSAEKYDYTDQEMFPRVQKRVSGYMDDFVVKSIIGYDSVSIKNRDYYINRLDTKYCLFPLWINYVVYNGKDYSFAMNAQTGKIAGKPPISKGKVVGCIFTVGIIAWVLIRLLVMLGGGTFI